MATGVGARFSAAVILSTTMIQLGVLHEYIGIATSMVIATRSTNGFIGTSLYTSILQSRLTHYPPTDVAIPLFNAQAPVQDILLIIEALLLGTTSCFKTFRQCLLKWQSKG
jgi:hypothetical protein